MMMTTNNETTNKKANRAIDIINKSIYTGEKLETVTADRVATWLSIETGRRVFTRSEKRDKKRGAWVMSDVITSDFQCVIDGKDKTITKRLYSGFRFELWVDETKKRDVCEVWVYKDFIKESDIESVPHKTRNSRYNDSVDYVCISTDTIENAVQIMHVALSNAKLVLHNVAFENVA